VNNNSKGFIQILVPILFTIIVLASIGYFAFKNGQIELISSKSPLTSPTPTINQTPAINTTNWKTYTNTQYGYKIKYPDTITLLINGKGSPGFIPVCDEYRSSGCLFYSENPFPKSNLEAAGLSINIIVNNGSVHNSVSSYSDKVYSCYVYGSDPANTKQLDKIKNINGINFHYGESGGAATGHQGINNIYRKFYNDLCYEVKETISTSSCENNFPDICPNKFTKEDEGKVFQYFDQILSTFKFTD
jgi:hypothetical protein